MDSLKIGDKVYHKREAIFGNNVYYKFSTVERLTKTQAILSCGTKVVNNPILDSYTKVIGFSQYGDRYNMWYMQTPEILEEAKIERERQKIVKWFNEHKFSENEKMIIYNIFKESGKLEL